MLRSLQGLFALGLVTVVIGCGKSPLTDEQKAQFKELTSSTSNVLKSAENAKSPAKSALAAAAGSDIEKRLRESQCDYGVPGAEGDLSKLSSLNITVSGESCPLTMNVGIKILSQNSAEFNMQFEIKDKDLAEASDVTKADLHGTISGSENSASGTIEGSILSKKYGSVGVRMTMSFNAGGGSIEVRYTFPTFTAIVEVNVSEDGATFKLNGEEVSQEQLAGAMPGASVPTATSSSESDSSLSYSFDYNGCKTEKQTFSSKEALCEGLKDNARNHGCAEDRRRQYFQSVGCSGSFDSGTFTW